jgi:hypothetical protein
VSSHCAAACLLRFQIHNAAPSPISPQKRTLSDRFARLARDLIINSDSLNRHGNRRQRRNGVIREDRMQRVDRPCALLAIKQQQVLDGLLALAQHVDDVLGQLATEERGDGGNLTPQVLQEAAQELGGEGAGRQHVQLVLVRGHHGEELQLLRVVRGQDAVRFELVLPQGAHAGQQRVDFAQAALVVSQLGWQGRVLDGHDGRVDLLLCHRLDRLAVLLLRRGLEDAARGALGPDLCCLVAEIALDDELVLDQVGEDVPVQAVGCAGVEGAVCQARAEVQRVGRVEVEVGRNDNVELGVEARLCFCSNGAGVRVDLNAGV